MSGDTWRDPKWIAALHGCCLRTVMRRIRSGKLAARRVGGRWRISERAALSCFEGDDGVLFCPVSRFVPVYVNRDSRGMNLPASTLIERLSPELRDLATRLIELRSITPTARGVDGVPLFEEAYFKSVVAIEAEESARAAAGEIRTTAVDSDRAPAPQFVSRGDRRPA